MNRKLAIGLAVGMTAVVVAIIVFAWHAGQGSAVLAERPQAGAWWSARQSGLVGGIGGSVVGIIGGLVGCLGGARMARGFVMGLLLAMGIAGLLGLCAGAVAVVVRQPYHVFYPLLLLGIILTPLSFALRPTLRAQYDATELQRMRSKDAQA